LDCIHLRITNNSAGVLYLEKDKSQKKAQGFRRQSTPKNLM